MITCKHRNQSGHPADSDIRMCLDCDLRSVDGGTTWMTFAEYLRDHCTTFATAPEIRTDPPRPIPATSSTRAKLPIDRPCSACSAGDYNMEHHDHAPPFRGESTTNKLRKLADRLWEGDCPTDRDRSTELHGISAEIETYLQELQQRLTTYDDIRLRETKLMEVLQKTRSVLSRILASGQVKHTCASILLPDACADAARNCLVCVATNLAMENGDAQEPRTKTQEAATVQGVAGRVPTKD